MRKFTRTNGEEPAPGVSRLHGRHVSVGAPVQLDGDSSYRQEIENTLEAMARDRLLEAEREANALVARAKADAVKLVESTLAKANAQAKEMLAQALEQETSIRENAQEEGFKAGFQEGYNDALAHVEQETVEMLEGANRLVEGARQAERLVLKNFERQAVEIIRLIGRKVLAQELETSVERIAAMLDRAVESLYLSGKVQVVVSPQIIQDLREYTDTIADAVDKMHRLEFIADAQLARDQIFIVGEENAFDLSIESQVAQLTAPVEAALALERTVMDAEPSVPSLPVQDEEMSMKAEEWPVQEVLDEDRSVDSSALTVSAPQAEPIPPKDALEAALLALQYYDEASEDETPDVFDELEAASSPPQALPFEFPDLEALQEPGKERP